MSGIGGNKGVYYYDNIFSYEGNIVGAKVEWQASKGVDKLRFDDWTKDQGEKKRFQPIIASNDKGADGGSVNFTWNFFYVGDDGKVSETDQEVALGRFWMNPIDLDGETAKWEFFDVLLEDDINELILSQQTFLETTNNKDEVSPFDLNEGWTRISGNNKMCYKLCVGEDDEEKYAAAINYFQPKSRLEFAYGVHGKNFGDGSPGTGRLFSVSIGDQIITDLEPPELTPLEDEDTITVDCSAPGGLDQIFGGAACLEEGNDKQAQFVWQVMLDANYGERSEYAYEFDVKGLQEAGYESEPQILGEGVKYVSITGGGKGTIVVEEGVEEFSVVVDVEAKKKLSGKEIARLTLRGGEGTTGNELSKEASLAELGCAPGGLDQIFGGAACLEEGNDKQAQFVWQVMLDANYGERSEYAYEFDVKGLQEAGYESEPQILGEGVKYVSITGGGKGTIVVEEGVEEFSVVVDVEAKKKLSGKEIARLTLRGGEGTTGNELSKEASLAELGCAPGGLDQIFGGAACLEEGNDKQAQFVWQVMLDANYGERSEYAYEFDVKGLQEAGYESEPQILGEGVKYVSITGGGKGTIVVEEGVEEFSVVVDVEAKKKLSGKEIARLTLRGGEGTTGNELSKEASLAELGCAPGGLDQIFGGAACLEEGNDKQAQFVWQVMLDANYGERSEYAYEFDVKGLQEAGYESEPQILGEGVKYVSITGGGKGTIVVEEGVEEFSVVVDVEAKKKLSGKEIARLTLRGGEGTTGNELSKEASLAELGCAPGGLDQIFGGAACLEEGNDKQAQFVWQVMLDANYGERSEYAYEFDVKGLQEAGYESEPQILGEGVKYVSITGGGKGTIVVEEGVEEFSVVVDVEAKKKLSGKEIARLTLRGGEGTTGNELSKEASLAELGCAPGGLDQIFGGAACLEEGNDKQAQFVWQVMLDANYGERSEYAYEFDVKGLQEAGYESEPQILGEGVKYVSITGGGKGTIVVEEGVEEFSVVVDVEAKKKLSGKEIARLTLRGGEGTTGNELSKEASLAELGCAPGGLDQIFGGAACLEEGNDKQAQFVWQVMLDANYGERSEYAYEFDVKGLQEAGYESEPQILGEGVKYVSITGGGKGTIVVEEGVEEFSVVVDVEAKKKLSGKEIARLTLRGGEGTTGNELSKEASLAELGCAPGGLDQIFGGAACLEEGNDKQAQFVWQVMLDANYGERSEYAYEFDVKGLQEAGYESEPQILGEGVKYVSITGGGKGTIVVEEGVEEFSVVVDVEAKKKLSGKEIARLTLRGGEGTTGNELSKEASLAELGCAPGGLDQIFGGAACLEEGNDKQAQFVWQVMLDANYGERSEYAYEFDVKGLQEAGYESEPQILGEGVKYVSITGGGKGTIVVEEGVEEFSVVVDVEAKKKLSGKEIARLTLRGGEGTTGNELSKEASLAELGCAPGLIDGISGTGECSDGDKQATYVFTVDVNPNYGESQTYAYEFVGDKGGFNQGFEVVGEPVLSGATLIGAGGTSGEIEVPAGESKVQVTVVLEAETKLTGKETLTLSVGDQESAAVGLGDGDCGVGSIESDGISGTGECSDGDKQATYVFTVDVNPNYGESQTYAYEFVGDKGGFNQGF
jgi:hypothetical protein